jgi:hypothetical protein
VVVHLVNDAGTEIVVTTNMISGRVVGPVVKEYWIRYGEGADAQILAGSRPLKITVARYTGRGGPRLPKWGYTNYEGVLAGLGDSPAAERRGLWRVLHARIDSRGRVYLLSSTDQAIPQPAGFPIVPDSQ